MRLTLVGRWDCRYLCLLLESAFALMQFSLEVAVREWILWGFCPSSVWARGFVPAWCVLCTLQTVVCRSGWCVSFLGKVKYLLWPCLVFISLDIKWAQLSDCESKCQRPMAKLNWKYTSGWESVWITWYLKAWWFSCQYQRICLQLRTLFIYFDQIMPIARPVGHNAIPSQMPSRSTVSGSG